MAERQADNGSTIKPRDFSDSGGYVGALVQQFDGQAVSTHNGYQTVSREYEHTSISIQASSSSTLGPTLDLAPLGTRSNTAHFMSDRHHHQTNVTNSNTISDSSSSDVGIIQMKIPDSVATLHHLNDTTGNGPYHNGVSRQVHKDILTAISNDQSFITQWSTKLKKKVPLQENIMTSMQWTLCAPVKLNPNTPTKQSTRKRKKMSSSPIGSRSQAVNSTPPSDRSDSDSDSTQPEDHCYIETFPPNIPSQHDPPHSPDPITQHHITKAIGPCETVLVQVWFTANHIHDASKKPDTIRMIQQRITKHVADILIGSCHKDRDKYRVFVIMNEMPGYLF